MTELETATTDELMDELCRRHIAVLIVTEGPSTPEDIDEGDHYDPDAICNYIRYKGSRPHAIGLAQHAINRITDWTNNGL